MGKHTLRSIKDKYWRLGRKKDSDNDKKDGSGDKKAV